MAKSQPRYKVVGAVPRRATASAATKRALRSIDARVVAVKGVATKSKSNSQSA